MDEFQIPEDVTAIEDLAAAEQAATEAADALAQVEDPTDEQLDQLEAIAAHIDAVREEGQRREGELQARRDRRDAARARIANQDGGDADGEDDGADDEGADDGEAGDGGSDEGDSGSEDEDTEGEGDAGETQAVAAGGTRRSAGRAPSLIRRTRQGRVPAPAQRTGSEVVITASAGIPNVEAGSNLDTFDQVVSAFQARAKAHPKAFAPNIYQRHSVVTFSRGAAAFGNLTQDGEGFRDDDLALLAEAGKESRLPKGSLAASGGWCAPSETLYDMVEREQAAGLIDLPEIGITRGGIRYTMGPDFGDIFAGVGFAQTEAQAIAGTEKDCYEVECPDFDEVRLDAVGLCIKSPLLTNAAYPELVRRVLRGAMVAHLQKVSNRLIASMATELGTAVVLPASGSVARSTLTGLELAAEGQRQRYSMGLNETMEVVLPAWARVVLRDDLQGRLRQPEPVTDAQLDAHFAARKLRVQFVYGYGATRIASVPGGGTLLKDFPDTMPAMLYPAGTFVKGTQDVISLDTVYDTTDLQSNVYTASFFEEGVLLARRAPGGGNLTIPVVSKGSVGPADLSAYGITDA